MVGLLHISAEEVNCLIYAYFKDSGFQHSAFVLRAEGQLEHSNVFRKHVPRGELIELLSKALLFSEVEAHWKGDKMSMSCHNPFKLLEHHVCSSPPPHLATAPSQPPIPASSAPNGSSTAHRHLPADNALKRKAGGTPVLEESPKEKRAKTRSPVEVEVAATSEPSLESRSVVAHPSVAAHENTSTVTQASQQHHKTEPDTAERETDETFVQTLKGHKAEAFVCSWNPVHTSTLASGSKDSVVQLWNIPGPDPNGDIQSQTALPITCDYPSKEEHGDLTSLDWSADGSLLAIGCYDSVLRICDTNGKMYFSHSQHDKGPIFAARFSPGGRWLATASLDGSVCVWDVQGKRLHRHYVVHEKCCLDVDWLSESEFATSGSDGLVQIMNINNPSPLKTLSGHKNEVNQVRSNPSRTRLASCSDDRTARIWNIEDIVYDRPQNDRVLLLKGHREAVSNIAWCPFTASGEHEMIVTSSFDHTTRIWDTVTGQCLKEFDDHKSSVYSLACSPDGRHFASAGGDGGVYIYNVQTKQKVWSYNAGRSVFELAWQQTDNYNRIAIAMLNGNVSVVDLTRIQELQ
ncbi:WD40 repeat-like protein [Lenzites betulinus]|nr:WD40 repeat-like protein [Lenzites betulinus]